MIKILFSFLKKDYIVPGDLVFQLVVGVFDFHKVKRSTKDKC